MRLQGIKPAQIFSALAIVVALIVVYLCSLTAFGHGLSSTFCLRSSLPDVLCRPWSIISYAFLHASPLHLAVNALAIMLLALWTLRIASAKIFFSVFFLGVLSASLCFIIASSILYLNTSTLIGASAGVCAVGAFDIIFSLKNRKKFKFNISAYFLIFSSALTFLIIILSGLFSENSLGAMIHFIGILAGSAFALVYMPANKNFIIPSIILKVSNSGFSSLTADERSALEKISYAQRQKK